MLERKRLEQLDGLRGLCALAVLVTHLIYGPYLATKSLEFYPPLILRSIASFGHLSVLIFFVLSGFVIGYTNSDKFTWVEVKSFVLKRLIRLYPIYLVSIILSFTITESPFEIKDVISHLCFLQVWLVPVVKDNLALWSLHYEFIFYLLFVGICKSKIKITKIIFICGVCGVLSAIVKFHLFEILGYFTIWLNGFILAKKMSRLDLGKSSFKSKRLWSTCILMAAYCSQNIFNMIICKYGTASLVLSDIISSILVTSIVATILGYEVYGYITSFYIVFLSSLVTVGYSIHQNTFYSADGILFGYQVSAFFLLFLPLTFFLCRIPSNVFKSLAKIGSISYALYVTHSPIQAFVYRHVPLNGKSSVINFCLASLMVIILSLICAWFLECYLHPKLSKRLKLKFGIY